MTVHKFPVVVASLAASVVHMLTTLEHVAPVLAEVMATLGNKYNSSQLVGDVLRCVSFHAGCRCCAVSHCGASVLAQGRWTHQHQRCEG